MEDKASPRSTTLMVWGDREAIICPWYLHVNNGHIKGLLYTCDSDPTELVIAVDAFCHQLAHVIKN